MLFKEAAMTLVKVIESVDEGTRRQADRLHRQLQDAIGSDSVTLRLEGPMIQIFRDVTAMMERGARFAMAPLADEMTPEQAGKILGISRPLVVRRMDDGRLPFRYEGAHRRCKLADVIKLKAIEDKQTEILQELAGMDDVDYQPAPKL
jgi:excisionase family DNA binding protein